MLRLAALLLAGISTAYGQKLHVTHEVPRVLVEVRWAKDLAEVRKLGDKHRACPKRKDVCNGFALLLQIEETGLWVCQITTVKPKAWSDADALQVLGHEALHCMGHDH